MCNRKCGRTEEQMKDCEHIKANPDCCESAEDNCECHDHKDASKHDEKCHHAGPKHDEECCCKNEKKKDCCH